VVNQRGLRIGANLRGHVFYTRVRRVGGTRDDMPSLMSTSSFFKLSFKNNYDTAMRIPLSAPCCTHSYIFFGKEILALRKSRRSAGTLSHTLFIL
jgi:hypothetical protein